jgi:sugar lactone lactonase YvrE
VTDTGNQTIRAVSTNAAVTTLAGSPGQNGATNATGSFARFDTPLGIAVDPDGMIYVVTTLAGSPGVWGTNDGIGSAALFNGPVGIALDDKTNLFVSDSNNHTIRKITPSGIVTTWAGTPGADGIVDGDRTAALFRKPADVKMDRNGNLFVVDSFNHTLRRIATNGMVTTVAGLASNSGSADGLGDQARLFNPYGLALDHNGNLRVSDTYNQTIRLAYAPITTSLARHASGNSFLITWQAIVGDVYQIQFKDPPLNSPWQNLGAPVTATNATGTALDSSTPSNNGRFYRVELLP